jgi:hypothetical protein
MIVVFHPGILLLAAVHLYACYQSTNKLNFVTKRLNFELRFFGCSSVPTIKKKMYSLDPSLQGYEENLSKFKGMTQHKFLVSL